MFDWERSKIFTLTCLINGGGTLIRNSKFFWPPRTLLGPPRLLDFRIFLLISIEMYGNMTPPLFIRTPPLIKNWEIRRPPRLLGTPPFIWQVRVWKSEYTRSLRTYPAHLPHSHNVSVNGIHILMSQSGVYVLTSQEVEECGDKTQSPLKSSCCYRFLDSFSFFFR